MKINNERTNVASVAERWRKNYGHYSNNFKLHNGTPAHEILQKLEKLDPSTATAADVAAIIGNNSWAGPSPCHECGAASPVTVEIGEPEDYDSHTAEICEGCLVKALDLIRASTNGTGDT